MVSVCTFHCADNPEILEGPGTSIARGAGEAHRSPAPPRAGCARISGRGPSSLHS